MRYKNRWKKCKYKGSFCEGAGEITLKKEKIYVKTKYQNKTIKKQNYNRNL